MCLCSLAIRTRCAIRLEPTNSDISARRSLQSHRKAMKAMKRQNQTLVTTAMWPELAPNYASLKEDGFRMMDFLSFVLHLPFYSLHREVDGLCHDFFSNAAGTETYGPKNLAYLPALTQHKVQLVHMWVFHTKRRQNSFPESQKIWLSLRPGHRLSCVKGCGFPGHHRPTN